jgi:acyl-ACP thioesterase
MASQDDGIWREEIRIHSYDVDFERKATLEAICRLFLEAAWNHAEALGMGFGHLAAQNQLWVLVRLLIRVGRYARWGESCFLHTWPREAKGIVAIREFEMRDRDGKQFGAGSSAWVVLDGTTKKPQRIDNLLRAIRTGPDRSPAGQEPSKLSPCLGPKTLQETVQYTDIDLNGHVNSGRYVAWLLDSYPFEFHRMNQVELLEVNYLGETRGGETVVIRSHEGSTGLWSHSIFRSDESEVCRARLVWIPRRPD